MTFDRTLVALAVYRRLMDDGPTFGDSPAKQRWDRQCLILAADIRQAFWLESGADAKTRDACFSMSVEEVWRAVNQARTP